MRYQLIAVICLAGLLLGTGGCAVAPGETPQEKRDRIQAMHTESLNMLYTGDPAAKDVVTNAPAYAVFNDMGGGFLLGGGSGWGLYMAKDSPNPIYMQAYQISGGIGLGYQGYRTIIVFDSVDAANDFADGEAQLAAQADAGVRFGQTGGIARAVGHFAPVRVYRIDPNGVILRAAIPVQFYSRYDKLN